MTEFMKFILDGIMICVIISSFGLFLYSVKQLFDQVVIWIKNGEI